MPQKIHYRDDLFLLTTLIRSLGSGLSVEADPEFFRERLIGDVFFIDSSLRSFWELLSQNQHLIDRAEYLKLLERNSRDYMKILHEVVEGSSPSSESLADYRQQFQGIIAAQSELSAEIRSILSEALEEGGSESDLVSQDELSQLLST